MACYFYLEHVRKNGLSPIFIRVQDPKTKLDVRQATKLLIAEKIWNTSKDSKTFREYLKNPEIKKIFDDTEEIRRIIDDRIESGIATTKDDVRQIVSDIIYKTERENAAKAAEEEARRREEAKKMTLMQFIDKYIEDISNGGRQTDKGTNYTPNTIKSIKQALTQFKNFCKHQKTEYNFNDIDMQFYHDFTAYLKSEIKDRKGNITKKAYNVNSIGKCIKQMKVIMFTAETEGHHSNHIWKDKKFKGTRADVDSIYLTKEDLEKIMAADLSKYGKGHDQARDIFMVGVWTAQRVSDYNNISKEQIDIHTKRWIEDVPDPENPGKTKPEIMTKEIMYIAIRQQKTGAQVSIPVSSDLKAILEKYDYSLPHLEDQVINRYLKDICKVAGLTEEVEIVETNGGTPKRVRYPKYELVHTHTARRTGATLMYLSGMDVYDIIKITGHTSPIMLKKYIKADKLEVLEKITDKYNYFD